MNQKIIIACIFMASLCHATDQGNCTTPRSITVHNKITPTMKTHSSFWGSHSPTKFELAVNGVTLKENETATIPIENDTLEMRYSCDFLGGIHTSKRVVRAHLDPQQKATEITFNWKEGQRLFASGAQKHSIIKK